MPSSDDPRTDLELIDAVNDGDADAFEVLYARHRDWVVNLAFRFTRDHELALDVLQDTFIYFMKKFPGFVLTARLTTFFYPTVKHLAIGAKKKVQRHAPGDEALAGISGSEPTEANDSRAELAQVMAALPETHREVLLLRFVDGFSLKEISAAIDIPVGTVKSRLHHGLGALRDDPKVQKYFEQ